MQAITSRSRGGHQRAEEVELKPTFSSSVRFLLLAGSCCCGVVTLCVATIRRLSHHLPLLFVHVAGIASSRSCCRRFRPALVIVLVVPTGQ